MRNFVIALLLLLLHFNFNYRKFCIHIHLYVVTTIETYGKALKEKQMKSGGYQKDRHKNCSSRKTILGYIKSIIALTR